MDGGGNASKRVGLTTKTCLGIPVHGYPDPGPPTPKRWKRLLPPDSSGAVEKVGVPRIFFLALVLVEVCAGDAWNLLSEETGAGFFSGWSVQPAFN